jgi:glycosyltransferase involved in cell wall biosynthesis
MLPQAETRRSDGEPGDVGARRVRVAFCIDNMNVGGTELNAVRTAERLSRSRYDLRVICLQTAGPLMERYRAAGIPVLPFPIPSLYAPATARQGLRLARYLRAERIDIFHAHDTYSNVFGGPWARLAGARVIASRRWWTELPGPAWSLATRAAYRVAHAVLANSAGVATLVRDGEGVPAERVAVVPNFVDEDAFHVPTPEERQGMRARLGVEPADTVVGIIANLLPVKDHASLLRAIASLAPGRPGLRLVLVGDGPERPALESLARELAIEERVRFAGRIVNKPNLHHAFDVSVLCSRSEGLSNSVLEAMAAGRPVVATDVGAIGDAVLDGVTGRLVPAGRPEALAGALGEVLRDPDRAVEMGERGRARARETYSPEAALSALEALYRRLLAGRPSIDGVN